MQNIIDILANANVPLVEERNLESSIEAGNKVLTNIQEIRKNSLLLLLYVLAHFRTDSSKIAFLQYLLMPTPRTPQQINQQLRAELEAVDQFFAEQETIPNQSTPTLENVTIQRISTDTFAAISEEEIKAILKMAYSTINAGIRHPANKERILSLIGAVALHSSREEVWNYLTLQQEAITRDQLELLVDIQAELEDAEKLANIAKPKAIGTVSSPNNTSPTLIMPVPQRVTDNLPSMTSAPLTSLRNLTSLNKVQKDNLQCEHNSSICIHEVGPKNGSGCTQDNCGFCHKNDEHSPELIQRAKEEYYQRGIQKTLSVPQSTTNIYLSANAIRRTVNKDELGCSHGNSACIHEFKSSTPGGCKKKGDNCQFCHEDHPAEEQLKLKRAAAVEFALRGGKPLVGDEWRLASTNQATGRLAVSSMQSLSLNSLQMPSPTQVQSTYAGTDIAPFLANLITLTKETVSFCGRYFNRSNLMNYNPMSLTFYLVAMSKNEQFIAIASAEMRAALAESISLFSLLSVNNNAVVDAKSFRQLVSGYQQFLKLIMAYGNFPQNYYMEQDKRIVDMLNAIPFQGSTRSSNRPQGF